MESMDVQAKHSEWVQYHDLIKNEKHAETIKITPFDGQILWIMTRQDKEKLTCMLLSNTGISGFADHRFQEGFYKYLLLETLGCFEKTGSYPDIHPRIELEQICEEPYFVMNICITVNDSTIWGKLAISSQVQKGICQHYNQKLPTLDSHRLTKDLDLLLKLELARTSLTVSEWKNLKHGDYLVLQQCSYDPATQKGSSTLVLEDTPLFKAKIKKNSLKIQDYAFFYEEQQPMTNEDLTPEDDSFHDEEIQEDPFHDEETDPEEFSDSFEDPSDDESDHMWTEKQEPTENVEQLISSREIPLTLVVELDRIRMNLDKLLQLSPGNVIELAARPEQGVYITVGGKKVAHAELIKIGDVVGLKILKMGQQE
jgi:flagellar motor switch protein FliN/FliY